MAVLVAHRLDIALEVCFIKDDVITAYILNETLSIIENMGLMSVPIPEIIKKSIEMLKKKE